MVRVVWSTDSAYRDPKRNSLTKPSPKTRKSILKFLSHTLDLAQSAQLQQNYISVNNPIPTRPFMHEQFQPYVESILYTLVVESVCILSKNIS